MAPVEEGITPKNQFESIGKAMGGKDEPTVDQESLPEGFGSSFSDKSVRMRFVRKVYSILLIQLLLTTGIIALLIYTPPIREFYCGSP